MMRLYLIIRPRAFIICRRDKITAKAHGCQIWAAVRFLEGDCMKLIDKLLAQHKPVLYERRNISSWFVCPEECDGECLKCGWEKAEEDKDHAAP